MAFKTGDLVRVLGSNTGDPFQKLQLGTTATICHVWEGQEYPYELLGHSECLQAGEIEAV